MAPKAQKRTLKTTRPRRNAARIAQERAKPAPRRSGSVRGNTKSKPPSGGKKVPGRATRVRRREARTEVRRGRFFILVGFMAILGFSTVYLGDAALSAFGSLKVDGKATSLWDKVVDRLLDRDIPGAVAPSAAAKKAKAPSPSPKALVKAAPLENKPVAPPPKVEKLPKVAVPKSPRAELSAPAPSEYVKESAPPPVLTEEQAAQERARRMKALLDRVGAER